LGCPKFSDISFTYRRTAAYTATTAVQNSILHFMSNFKLASSHEEMNPGRRNTMEDVHRIVPALGGDPTLSYFSVYDGHGGILLDDIPL
jgi:hypothetical protein